MSVKLWPSLGHGWGPFRGGFGFNFFHSHLWRKTSDFKYVAILEILVYSYLEACSSQRSLLYLPYSTMPPNTRMRVPSTTKPKAAQPGGMSPLTGGTNHWFVAEERKRCHLQRQLHILLSETLYVSRPHQFRSSFQQKDDLLLKRAASIRDSLGKFKAAASLAGQVWFAGSQLAAVLGYGLAAGGGRRRAGRRGMVWHARPPAQARRRHSLASNNTYACVPYRTVKPTHQY